MSKSPLRFIHFTDTHFGPTKDFIVAGVNSCERAERLVKRINSLPAEYSFVIHTGDVVNDPDLRSYSVAARVLSKIKKPLYFVTGNHDRSEMIAGAFKQGPQKRLSDKGLVYRFDFGAERFLTLDARGTDAMKGNGKISEAQLSILARELKENPKKKITLFLHFQPIPLDSLWLDTDMHIVNGVKIHKLLARYAERVRGVFFGHIHQNFSVVKEGVFYCSSGPSSFPMRSWPDQRTHEFDLLARPSFNLVTYLKDQVIVQGHAF